MRLIAVVLALGCAVTVTGCTRELPDPAPSSSSKSPEPVPTVPADPWPVPVARAPGWEPFLITEVRRGNALLGPVRIPVDRVFVDLVCDGEGEASLVPLVNLPDEVDKGDRTTRISFPCRRGGLHERLRQSVPPKGLITSAFDRVVTLRVEAPAGTRWALRMEAPTDSR